MKTTVITTTCGIIYSRQFEWLMWKNGWAAKVIEGWLGQFLCDCKQCPHCMVSLRDTNNWHKGLLSLLIPFFAASSPQHSPPPETLKLFFYSQGRKSEDSLNFSSLGGVRGSRHLADVIGDSPTARGQMRLMGPCKRLKIVSSFLPPLLSDCVRNQVMVYSS
jgi:hypothetical protein